MTIEAILRGSDLVKQSDSPIPRCIRPNGCSSTYRIKMHPSPCIDYVQNSSRRYSYMRDQTCAMGRPARNSCVIWLTLHQLRVIFVVLLLIMESCGPWWDSTYGFMPEGRWLMSFIIITKERSLLWRPS